MSTLIFATIIRLSMIQSRGETWRSKNFIFFKQEDPYSNLNFSIRRGRPPRIIQGREQVQSMMVSMIVSPKMTSLWMEDA
jgi:hypothetical protein